MKLQSYILIFILILNLLTGCGSNSTSAQNIPATSVSGKAVAGAITSGSVYLKDSLNREISTVTAADGSYAFDTTGLKKPFLMKAVFSNNSTLYSIVADNGVAHINSATNWIANFAAVGLRLAEVYLYIKGELLVLLANIAGSIANSITS
jgi:hypothetical protein